MITVLENVKDREQVSSGEEELHLADEEIGQEEELSELGITPRSKEFGLSEDSLSLYLDEVGQTPLLNAEEEKMLGSQIEEGKHLVRLEEEWIAEHGAQPSANDLLLVLKSGLPNMVLSLRQTTYC
jgi:DNA-directed RNA polymerase sigma subunit (sigma70/sigma32)